MEQVVKLEFLCTKKNWSCEAYRNSFVEHVVRGRTEDYMHQNHVNRVNAYVRIFTIGCYGDVVYVAQYANDVDGVKELSRKFLCS